MRFPIRDITDHSEGELMPYKEVHSLRDARLNWALARHLESFSKIIWVIKRFSPYKFLDVEGVYLILLQNAPDPTVWSLSRVLRDSMS